MMHMKFKHVFYGQIVEPVTRVPINDYQVFMKIPGDKMKLGACACGCDLWNAININANGVFTVHFCPENEVIVKPGENAFNDIKRKMRDYVVTTNFDPPLGPDASLPSMQQTANRPD